jgi:hypothetical protein
MPSDSSVTPKEETKRGTVTRHYFNFVTSCMDVMDSHTEFKDALPCNE